MSLQILDASVAIQWFVADEVDHSEAIRILCQVRDSPFLFVVPELFFNEMLAVLARFRASMIPPRWLRRVHVPCCVSATS